jgi:hypothetical protein
LNGCSIGLISRVGLLRNVPGHSGGDICTLGLLDRVAETMIIAHQLNCLKETAMKHEKRTFGGRIRPKEDTAGGWANLVELANEGIAFIYQRLSTHEQVKRSIYSIKAQDALVDLANEDGYSKEQIHVEKRDLGVSGTKGREQREGLAYLIDCIERDMIESIYVVHISRLFRDQTLIDALAFGELCKAHQVIIVTPQMRLNLRDRMHMRLYRMEVERAADELELMQSRLGSARNLKGRQGYYCGQNLPTGYVLDLQENIKVDGKVTKNENYQKMQLYEPHAKVVRQIFRLARRRMTETQIARCCKREGIVFSSFPPELRIGANMKNFLRLRKNADGSWPVTISRVRSILKNPAYIGWRIWEGEVVTRNGHPPAVDEETFWAVQEQFGTCKKRPKEDRPPLPLAGILQCGHHDVPRQMIYSHSQKHPPGSYQCRSVYADEHCCRITAGLLDTAICEAVISQCCCSDLSDQVLNRLTSEYQQAQERAAAYKRELRRLENEVENLEHNFTLRLSPERAAWIEAEIQERLTKITELSSPENHPVGQLVGPKVTGEDVELVKAFLADLRTGWNAQPDDLKNAFLNLILERVVIYAEKRTVRAEIIWRTGLVQEILIHRRVCKRRWTEDEEKILREHFETTPILEILKLFPERTWNSIYQRARALDLSRPNMTGGAGRREEKLRCWTEEEDVVLRKYYDDKMTWVELLEQTGRSPKALRARAYKLGLGHKPKTQWEWIDKGMMVTKGEQSALPA